MTTAPSTAETTAFYQLLYQTPALDKRDNRGKKHPSALILTGLTCALGSGRDGSLSRLHRHMAHYFSLLAQATASTQPSRCLVDTPTYEATDDSLAYQP